jgi:ABC-2 type transport system permease protein
MNNILAVAHKELKSYFASPIAYIVIGFFALLYGWFFYTLLAYFQRQSMQADSAAGRPTSTNR